MIPDTHHGYWHGALQEGVLTLYGTYPAGEGPDWGWRI
jgi:hypothetical protein